MSTPLELRQGTLSSSRDLLVPSLELQQGARGPFKLWLGLGVPLSLQRVLSVPLRYSMELRAPLEFWWVLSMGGESSLDLSLGSPH